MEDRIRKLALQNAVKFNGKANPGAVIGKIMQENKDLSPKDIAGKINFIIKEVNSMTPDEQKKELDSLGGAEVITKEKKTGLKELDDVKGKVIMRFEPSPSGPLHIGHSYVLGLNSGYCKKYNGKLILRIADTNPENIYDKAYDMIPEDGKWVTKDNISKVIIQSDRLEIYYKYAKDLIEKGNAYVCLCDPEEFREKITKKVACACRNQSTSEQLKRWENMFDKYKQGQAVVRIKTDVKHKNPAMRDWPALRINESPHPRQGKKFKVWPLMNFSVAIDDIEFKLTHIIRAKDHADNAKRQEYIYNYLNKKIPETLFVGRINFTGLKLSTTETKEKIAVNEYHGWDDIRLPFLPALRRRGYQPDAFMKYAIDVGVSKNDKSVSKEDFFKTIDHLNKEIIDPTAKRLFFINRPRLIKIEEAPDLDIELDLHPDNIKKGRKFKTSNEFYIEEDDFKEFKDGKIYRLMDCINFVKEKDTLRFHSTEYEKFKEVGEKIIHWLPKEDLIEIQILMPDNNKVNGLAENTVKIIKQGEIVQFERFGFCRLDDKDQFWFTHK